LAQVFLVPTTITYQALAESGAAAGMPAVLVAKVGDCVGQVGLLRSWCWIVPRDCGTVVLGPVVASLPNLPSLPRHWPVADLVVGDRETHRDHTAPSAAPTQPPFFQGLRAVALARSAGVKIAFGSDLLGELHMQQAGEFRLRSSVQPAAELVQAATVTCAELFMMEMQIGQVGCWVVCCWGGWPEVAARVAGSGGRSGSSDRCWQPVPVAARACAVSTHRLC
jgi:hypothetical protein